VVFYRGPAAEQFCQLPCPSTTEQIVVDLVMPIDSALLLVMDPRTATHCSVAFLSSG